MKKTLLLLSAVMAMAFISCESNPIVNYLETDKVHESLPNGVDVEFLNGDNRWSGLSLQLATVIKMKITNNGNGKVFIGNRSMMKKTFGNHLVYLWNVDSDTLCHKKIRCSWQLPCCNGLFYNLFTFIFLSTLLICHP